jgi:predicted amidohydrolase
MTRIAVQQLAPALGDLQHNRALADAAIRDAVAAGPTSWCCPS